MSGVCVVDAAFEALLSDTLSPDPRVQKRTLQVLEEWKRAPPPGVVERCLAVLTDNDGGGRPTGIRQAAASILKQLLKAKCRSTLAVTGTERNGIDVSVMEVLQAHLSSMLVAMTTSTSVLQTAIASLVSTILKVATMLCQERGNELWMASLQYVHRCTRESLALLQSNESVDDTVDGQLVATATLLQLLCEDCAKEFREFLGADETQNGAPSGSRSLALCEIFESLLMAGEQRFRQVTAKANVSSSTSALLLRTVSTAVVALRIGFREDVLPTEHPFDENESTGMGGSGQATPAMESLHTVMARSAAIHMYMVTFATALVFPWLMSPHESDTRVEHSVLGITSALFEYMLQMSTASGHQASDANNAFLSASIPLILAIWQRVSPFEVGRRDTNDPLENVVSSSLDYLSSVALLGPTATFSQSLPQILDAALSLCVLPLTVVHSQEYATQEHDTHVADDPTSVRVVLQKADNVATAEWHASDSDEDNSAAELGDAREPSAASHSGGDNGGGSTAADESMEEDNVKRELVSTLLNNVSTAHSDDGQLVAYLFPSTLSIVESFSGLGNSEQSTTDPRVLEAALFVLSEVVEGCLSSAHVAPKQVSQIAQVASALARLLSQDSLSVSERIPFYARAQAVVFLGRATAAVVESLLRKCPSPTAHFLDYVSLDALLLLLSDRVVTEKSKLVQRQCIGALTRVCTACLRPAVDSMDADADDDDDSDENDECTKSVSQAPRSAATLINPEAFARHILALLFSTADDAPIQEVSLRLMQSLPNLQLGPRTAVYDFLGNVIPLMAERSVLLHPQAMATVLEVLAGQCAQAIPSQQNGRFSGEAAYLLVTISQVVVGVGPLVAPAVFHFAALARYVVSLCRGSESTTAESVTSSRVLDGGLDANDVLELALDLLSSLCDAMIDRDAVLPFIALRSGRDTSVVADTAFGNGTCEAMERLAIVQRAFHPSTDASVLTMCIAILCQRQAGDGARGAGAENGVRRACLGLVYDCLIVCSPAARIEVSWPLMEAILVGDLHTFMTVPSLSEALKAIEYNEAASNALLCLAEATFLVNGTSELANVRNFHAALESATPVLHKAITTLISTVGATHLETVVLSRGIKLNMVNALAGLTAFLAVHGGSLGSSSEERLACASRVLQLTSSQLRHFAHFARDGCYECVQVVTSLAQLLSTLPGMLAMPSLADVLQSQRSIAAAAAKTVLVVSKCVTCFSNRQAAVTVLGDWVGIARVVASAENVLFLSAKERHAVRVVMSLAEVS